MSLTGRRKIEGEPSLPNDVALWTALGLGLASVGAYGTAEAAPLLSLAFWLSAMLAGGMLVRLTATTLPEGWRFSLPAWVRQTLIGALAVIPVSTLVCVLGASIFGTPLSWARFAEMLPQVAVVMALLQFFRAQTSASSQRTSAVAALLARLPARFHNAELWALQAEDHYIRVHTSGGSALLPGRFSDAVADLDKEGVCVHRSWWICSAAVPHGEWIASDRKLHLPGGLCVPVSRRRVAAVRRFLA